ncbi:MAG: hypothetical protein IPP94_04990 [Ignavibacteria bacterium]|nr:hypothetical protein [Ignavibacteria bacterium]
MLKRFFFETRRIVLVPRAAEQLSCKHLSGRPCGAEILESVKIAMNIPCADIRNERGDNPLVREESSISKTWPRSA